MHYFISAGEASGDIHAARLIEALRAGEPGARFTFLGGDEMSRAAGGTPIVHYRDMAFMGFSEVLRNLRRISSNLTAAKEAIRKDRPDCVVLVDYPSFNLKLAAEAKRLGLPVAWFIAPKVWAWKEWRVKTLRRHVDLMLSILPFEPAYFSRHGIDALYVGNPSVEEINEQLSALPRCESSGKPMLLLVPGSRVGEIRNNLPVMDAVARRHPDMEAIVAGAPGIDYGLYSHFTTLPVVEGRTLELMKEATAALVTSGTASLECALAGTPQVVCYRANGSRLSYAIMRRLIKVDHVALPNLIAGHTVVPEMLLHMCTPDAVDSELCAILPGSEGRERQLQGYAEMRERLGSTGAGANAAAAIHHLLNSRE